TGYLPMYIAMANGYFAESDIVVKIVTIETGGGHTNAVLSGQAFAFIGGPQHHALPQTKGAQPRAGGACVRPRKPLPRPPQGPRTQRQGLADLFQGQGDCGRPL